VLDRSISTTLEGSPLSSAGKHPVDAGDAPYCAVGGGRRRRRVGCLTGSRNVSRVARVLPPTVPTEHKPENAMGDREEIARFYDRGSDLMRELLEALAATPERLRTFPEVEDLLAWPRRRIASVLGGVWHLRMTEFGGRRPYRFMDEDRSTSGRWEIWTDTVQAEAIRDAQGGGRSET
jgi:hypothetical protein